MKLKYFLTACLCAVFLFGTNDAVAQYGKKKKKRTTTEKSKSSDSQTRDYFDESGGFKHKMWYGGGLTFQIFSTGPSSSQMVLGLSPMAGYKIGDIFSVGARTSVNYAEIFQNGTNPRALFIGVGPFARVKFSDAIFAHAEYEFRFEAELNDRANTFPDTDNLYLGAGFNSPIGNGWGFEIMLLYNFGEERDDIVPIEYRAGGNWNF
jgi:hypothetical protein